MALCPPQVRLLPVAAGAHALVEVVQGRRDSTDLEVLQALLSLVERNENQKWLISIYSTAVSIVIPPPQLLWAPLFDLIEPPYGPLASAPPYNLL